jgi:hypothetical protein
MKNAESPHDALRRGWLQVAGVAEPFFRALLPADLAQRIDFSCAPIDP